MEPDTRAREVAPGVVLVMEEDQICGSWLLVNGNECFILETPPKAIDGDSIPAEMVASYIEGHGLRPVGLAETHHHWDHVNGIAAYWDALLDHDFPRICHASLIDEARKLKPFFNVVFSQETYEMGVAGEPLYMIHAPKHCFSDMMVVFRGTMITGDWWLGRGDPNPNHVPPRTSIESIDRIISVLESKNYTVHRLFSVHANDFRYDVNAIGTLLDTRRYHEYVLGNQ